MPSRSLYTPASVWFLLPVVVLVPMAAFGTLVLRHFYVLGAFWSDSGAIAAVMWHSDPLLRLPLVNGAASFFQYHIAPFFLLLSLLSRLIPFSEVWFFAIVSGVAFMLPGLAVYWLLVGNLRMTRGFTPLAAAGISLLFAFNGMALAVSRNPHFEMLIVGTGMMFLVGLLQKRYVIATIFFMLCLTIREDAGLHLVTLLGVFSFVGKFSGISLNKLKPVLIYGGVALLYSLLAIAVQKLYFPGYDALRNVYIGSPASPPHGWPLVPKLLIYYVIKRGFIFLPAYLALAWAYRARNIMLAAGYLAVVPWAILSLFAVSPWAATLSGYYCFPFIFALFWVLLGPRLAASYGSTQPPLKYPVVIFSLLLLTSYIELGQQYNPGHIALPQSFYQLPSAQLRHVTAQALQDFVQDKAQLGSVKIDSGVAALDPRDYTGAQLVEMQPSLPADTIIYFANGYQLALVLAAAQKEQLDNYYLVPGTSLRVVSRRQLTGIAGLAPAPG
ncbi:MAG: hypothetical protein POG74_07025 [Acidocella sp.]|nr:hypothetical protein [Acidocella sp.]